MQENKNTLIIGIALAVSLLVGFPRVVLLLMNTQIAQSLGFTMADVGLRTLLLFLFSYVVLKFHLVWKERYYLLQKTGHIASSIALHAALVLFFISCFTILKNHYIPGVLGRRRLFFGAMFSYLFVLLILLLVVRIFKLSFQRQQDIIEKEQAKQSALKHQLMALQNQVNPHFLFNALNSLNALIHQQSDKASVFVDRLSLLLRHSLKSSEQDQITIAEELAFLEHYIFLQKERFGEKLQLRIDIADELKQELIPAFALQLLVENAIKHNVISTKKPLQVQIQSAQNQLVVSNNVQLRRDRVDSTGIGLANLSKRFEILKKGSIDIQNTTEEFIVKLPL